MADKDYVVVLRFREEDRHKLEELAHKRGFDDLDTYMRALIVSDAQAQGETLAFDEDEDVVGGFLQGWHEAMTGNTRPLSELLDALNEEE